MAHGEFGKWLETVNLHDRQAQRLMKVATEFGANTTTWSELPFRSLYEIATMPEEQRTQPHTIPSTQETKTVDEMTVRELREVKKALKEAEAKAQQAVHTYY